MTLQTLKVLHAMVKNQPQRYYGLELVEATSLPSGSIYPILARLKKAGWVSSDWEDVDPAKEGRPRRRFYRLTDEGLQRARDELASFDDDAADAFDARDAARNADADGVGAADAAFDTADADVDVAAAVAAVASDVGADGVGADGVGAAARRAARARARAVRAREAYVEAARSYKAAAADYAEAAADSAEAATNLLVATVADHAEVAADSAEAATNLLVATVADHAEAAADSAEAATNLLVATTADYAKVPRAGDLREAHESWLLKSAVDALLKSAVDALPGIPEAARARYAEKWAHDMVQLPAGWARFLWALRLRTLQIRQAAKSRLPEAPPSPPA
ncbi:hypothetical protein FDG2_0858 [Candidatus Protofrankia californiensis]|uniref:Transcription regulator PadR N-terminal domain-containing protein n=1 Tax=Candidatus Protofrankia californiensis TaxID=1839754 RepID=A0A1C3NUF8_9ACTN|nr:hypothetical protein FDG2_0858 [Candidatus Protofrankia californiensis]